jgi:hypothetical protein
VNFATGAKLVCGADIQVNSGRGTYPIIATLVMHAVDLPMRSAPLTIQTGDINGDTQ